MNKHWRNAQMLFALGVCSVQVTAVAGPGDLFGATDRLQPFGTNYAISQRTDGDNGALEATYAFRFMLTGEKPGDGPRWRESMVPCDTWAACRTTYFKYRGLFDFYFGTRLSGPVIHRINNPALELRQHFNRSWAEGVFLRHASLGIEHLSNGQTADLHIQPSVAARARRIFGENPDSAFFDTISREVDFVSVAAAFRMGADASDYDAATGNCRASSRCFDVALRWRPYYIHDDNPVTWGPSSWRTSEVADFDLVKLTVARRWVFPSPSLGLKGVELGAEWTVGEIGLDGDSLDVAVTLPVQLTPKLALPLYLRWHRGPLNNLSNYSRPQNAFGIGVRLN